MGDAYALYFVNQKMMPGSRLDKVLSFIHARSWSLTSIGVSSFSATDGLGTLKQTEYFHCTDPICAPSFLGANIKKQQSSGHGFAWDIPADRKGWPVISAGAALGSQMPLRGYVRMTKTRCNSLIFLPCLLISIFKAPDSVGMKTWLRETHKILPPHAVLVLCDKMSTVCARTGEEDDIRITSRVKGDSLAFHRRYLHV